MGTSRIVGHLPVARAYLDRLGLVETVNRLAPGRMKVDPGTLLSGAVLNVLETRFPLYRMSEFYRGRDCEGLLGVGADALNDDNLGRALDLVYRAGTWNIFSEVGLNAFRAFGLDGSEVHHDTTSVSVWGEYRGSGAGAVRLAYGHSKDRQPDLKQFIVSLLCVERDIPVQASLHDGNASDKKINGRVLEKLGRAMAKYGLKGGEFVYVSDSALVTEENLSRLEGTDFLTRLPATYGECGRLVAEAVAAGDWEPAGALAEKPAGNRDARARYRLREGEAVLYGRTYRALVVHSDAHDRRRRKKIEKQVRRDGAAVGAALADLSRKVFACEPDARRAAESVKGRYHRVGFAVEGRPVYARGRPRQDGTRAVARVEYRVRGGCSLDEKAVARLEEEAGCFVLLTSIPAERKTGRDLLAVYKAQDGIEKNFGFLKDPLVVNDLFLKSPRRIEAMGLVLVLALLVDRLLQREMRRHVAARGPVLQGWTGRPTQKPTTFMLRSKFSGLMVRVTAAARRLETPLNGVQLEFLAAVGLDPKLFLKPPPTPARPSVMRR